MEKSPAIGIDLGTTYSCVGIFQHGKVEIIANDQGNRTTPSHVAFTDTERLIGDSAKMQVAHNPQGSIFDVKRLIGRHFSDSVVQADMKHWPFSVVNKEGKPHIQVQYKGEERFFAPEEISSMVLVKMKETAEAYLGETVSNAVITVPAYFNDSQRHATKDTGHIAGLNVLRIINEPTAASLAYGLNVNLTEDKNVLIFDLGGGTFDVSILNISDSSVFEVQSTAGDTHLGGEDFDNRLVDHFVTEFRRTHQKDIRKDKRALRRLRMACERAKRTLSSNTEASIEIDSLSNGVDFQGRITRARFEELCVDLFRSCLEPVERALRDAKMKKEDIHDIVLVGGSTRIPRIQKMLQDFFNGKELNKSINPDEAVAYGAAIQAAILTGDEDEIVKELLLIDVTPLSLGVRTKGGIMERLIERNTKIPKQTSKYYSTVRDNQTEVEIAVYEGERPLVKDNNLLGVFDLTLPPAPMGDHKIEVTFNVDTNGILSVTAVDIGTGKSNKVIITNSREGLSRNDIERMVEEAEKFKVDDDTHRERIQQRLNLEKFVTDVHRTVREDKEHLTAEDKESVDKKVEEMLEWIGANMSAEKDEFLKKSSEFAQFINPIYKKFNDVTIDGDNATAGDDDGVKGMDSSGADEESNQPMNL